MKIVSEIDTIEKTVRITFGGDKQYVVDGTDEKALVGMPSHLIPVAKYLMRRSETDISAVSQSLKERTTKGGRPKGSLGRPELLEAIYDVIRAAGRPLSIPEIEQELMKTDIDRVSRPTLTKYVEILKTSGVLRGTQFGRVSIYTIAKGARKPKSSVGHAP